MTIKSKRERKGKIEIDLTGQKRNAFYIMSQVRKLAKPLGLDHEKIIWDEMIEADNYDEVLAIFDKYFGDYVTIHQ